MRGIFPDDYRLWAAVTVLTGAPLGLAVHLPRLARRAWLAPTAAVVVDLLAVAAVLGWLACIAARRFGVRLTPRLDRASVEDYDDAMLPPFLVPVPPDPATTNSADPSPPKCFGSARFALKRPMGATPPRRA
jgi:hypothetical protein